MAGLTVIIQMLTYNHGSYIRQAIESVVTQQTDFTYCLLVIDDCSTDNTGAICRELKEKYPDKIRLIINEQNIGAIKNAEKIIQLSIDSQAKYVAVCEGDDYWTEPLKLQKQVEFLEGNPEYAICFHRVYELRGENKSIADDNMDVDKTYSILDLAERNLIHTPSVLFRNDLISLPGWYHQSPVGDYVLHMLNARKGLIRYFSVPMAAYRIHESGKWSTKPRNEILENWRIVLNVLLTGDFSEAVKERLRLQRRKINTEHLRIYFPDRQDLFLEKLSSFSAEDPELAKEWLIQHYPTYINNLKGSKTFRFAVKLSKWKQKLVGNLRRGV